MAKRDPEITARNKIKIAMKEEGRQLLPRVPAETGIESEAHLALQTRHSFLGEFSSICAGEA